MKPTLLVLCGVPYSGKTTLRKRILNSPLLKRSVTVLSTDDLLLQWAKNNNCSYEEAYHVAKDAAKIHMLGQMHEAVRWRQDIIFDRTNYNSTQRSEVLRATDNLYTRIAVVCEVPKEILLERSKGRNRQAVPTEKIDQFIEAWEPPTETEGFDAVLSAAEVLTTIEGLEQNRAA